MAHNAACTCVECASQRGIAGQMAPPMQAEAAQAAFRTFALEPVTTLRGGVRECPTLTEHAILIGVSELELPSGQIAVVVVLCDDGRTRAIWWDRETRQMRAAVVLAHS
jgi:hypothetical protein